MAKGKQKATKVKPATVEQLNHFLIDVGGIPSEIAWSRSGLMAAWFVLVNIFDVMAELIGKAKFEDLAKNIGEKFPPKGMPIIEEKRAKWVLFGGELKTAHGPIQFMGTWPGIINLVKGWNKLIEAKDLEGLKRIVGDVPYHALYNWNLLNSVAHAWAAAEAKPGPGAGPFQPTHGVVRFKPIPWRPEKAAKDEMKPYFGDE
jgi:hypothetical protein